MNFSELFKKQKSKRTQEDMIELDSHDLQNINDLERHVMLDDKIDDTLNTLSQLKTIDFSDDEIDMLEIYMEDLKAFPYEKFKYTEGTGRLVENLGSFQSKFYIILKQLL